MRRRKFVGLVAAAAATWPCVLGAQTRAKPAIGFLRSSTAADSTRLVAAFREGLKATGYVENESVTVEYRWADNDPKKLPALAAELVKRKVDVIVVNQASTPAARAATVTIPIVFVIGGDPVELGFVSSLGRPSGNLTGVTFLSETIETKRLEILRELKPKATQFAVLLNANSANAGRRAKELAEAARSLAVRLQVKGFASERELGPIFAALARDRVEGLLVASDVLITSLRRPIVEMAARHAVPAIYASRDFVVDGGFLSYGASQVAAYRRAAGYASRILKGSRVTDLPVEQSTDHELVANLKTAKALGITLPPSLRLRVSEFVE